jgi:hypothetical protein
MEIQRIKRFILGFAITFLILIGAWIAVDGFAHLDEFWARSGPDQSMLDAAVVYYESVVRLHGRSLFGAAALAAAAFALVLSRRRVERRSGTLG